MKRLQLRHRALRGCNQPRSHACPQCGVDVVKIGRAGGTYCKRCARRRGRTTRRECKRRRSVRIMAATVERFSDAEIYERDEWRCQLCGEKVDRRAKVPHHRAATIDHIIPVSRGGEHSRRNVQCAHFICNTRKRDQLQGQLRIFG